MNRLRSFWESLNPVLVREVRQALRGRFFGVTFALVLTLSTLTSIGILLLTDESTPLGQALLGGCIPFLMISTCYLVPIGAFYSLGAEHDDMTRDLLVMSNLSPGKIIRGKFISSFMLTLLFTITLAPFISLAALLRGVDLLQIASQLTMVIMKSALFIISALCLSSIAPNRSMRVVLMLLMVFLFMMADALMVPFGATMVVGFAGSSHSGFSWLPMVSLTYLLIGSFAYALARGRFTHPEENRSSPLRVHITVAVFAVNGLFLCFPWLGSGSLSMAVVSPRVLPTELLFTSLIGLSIAAFLFSCEPGNLKMRVKSQVPAKPISALLAWPYFPGGGRAVVWYLLNAGVLLLLAGGGRWITSLSFSIDPSFQAAVLTVFVTLGCLLWPAALVPHHLGKGSVRVMVILVPLMLILIGTISYEASRAAWNRGVLEHPIWGALSPLGLLTEVADHGFGRNRAAVLAIVAMGGMSLLLNLRRIIPEALQYWRVSRDKRTSKAVGG